MLLVRFRRKNKNLEYVVFYKSIWYTSSMQYVLLYLVLFSQIDKVARYGINMSTIPRMIFATGKCTCPVLKDFWKGRRRVHQRWCFQTVLGGFTHTWGRCLHAVHWTRKFRMLQLGVVGSESPKLLTQANRVVGCWVFIFLYQKTMRSVDLYIGTIAYVYHK